MFDQTPSNPTEAARPLTAVPTTSGTGSEVARGAIIVVDDHRKLGFQAWHLLPKTAIYAPELMPRLATADDFRHMLAQAL